MDDSTLRSAPWRSNQDDLGRLHAGRTPRAPGTRLVSVSVAAGILGVLFGSALLGVAVSGQLPWPFPLRPSLLVLDDPDLRHEIALALLVLAGALPLATLPLVFRRHRWAGLLLAAPAIVYAAPHLRLLLVEAYPTSYYRSPTAFASGSIVRGQTLFAQACTSCHGGEGRGDGPLARTLVDPPADLTAPHLWEHEDGELFWWLSHGIDGPEGGLVMPGFAESLPANDRWALIDYVRAHNAGVSMRATGRWAHPVPMPAFVMHCPDGVTIPSGSLRGRVLRLIVTGGRETPAPLPPAQAGVDITDVYTPAPPAASGGCTAAAPDFVAALATVTGSTVDGMAGSQFLVDPDGFLRARHGAGASDGWSDTRTLLAQVGRICTHPVTPDGGDDAQAR